MQRNLPSWVVLWLLFTGVVCTIDALFIILRPHTLPGGKWNYLITPYNIYIEVDERYIDLKDAFVIGVSWMNLTEVALNFFILAMHVSGKAGLSILLTFMVSTMTWSKTILYFLLSTSVCGGEHYISHNAWRTTILLYVIPNGIWIIIPFLCMIATGRKMLLFMESDDAKTKKYR